MKSSIRVSHGGNRITFRGLAARKAFEALSGTKLPAPKPTDVSRVEITPATRAETMQAHGRDPDAETHPHAHSD